MNIQPRRPPGPGPHSGWEDLAKLADRIEKHVRAYRWLTIVNVIVFGTNATLLFLYLVTYWWGLRH